MPLTFTFTIPVPTFPTFVLSILYIVAFAFAFRFARRRARIISLALLGIGLVLPFIISILSTPFEFWLGMKFLDLYPNQSDLFSAVPQLSFIYIGFGLFGAAVTKFIQLQFKYSKNTMLIFIFVGLFAFYIIIFIFNSISLSHNITVPSKKCLESRLYFKVGNEKIIVPANPTMLLNTGSSSLLTEYFSGIDSFMRELCRRADDARAPLSITHLAFMFAHLDNSEKYQSAALHDLLCAHAGDAGGKLLCEASAYKPAVPRTLSDVNYYLPSRFKIDHAESYQYSTFAAAKAGNSWTATQSGLFDKYPDGYYITHGTDLPGIGGDPAVVHCTDDKTTQGSLSCTTARSLPGGMIGTVTFTTLSGDLDQTALAADQAVVELLQDLAAK